MESGDGVRRGVGRGRRVSGWEYGEDGKGFMKEGMGYSGVY